MKFEHPILKHRLTIDEARKALKRIDTECKHMTEEQKRNRNTFAAAIDNAHKLQYMFFGMTDKGSIDAMNANWLQLALSVGYDGSDSSPSKMLH